jgi:hypothetical protein
MGKMNYERANKIQRTGKAQSEYADADNPPGIRPENIIRTPEQEAGLGEKILQQEELLRKKEEIRHQISLEEIEKNKVRLAINQENNKALLQEQSVILNCKPDGSDAWTQLQKLKAEKPEEGSKYWEAYHRINEILNRI